LVILKSLYYDARSKKRYIKSVKTVCLIHIMFHVQKSFSEHQRHSFEALTAFILA